jgi:hypothetical protein
MHVQYMMVIGVQGGVCQIGQSRPIFSTSWQFLVDRWEKSYGDGESGRHPHPLKFSHPYAYDDVNHNKFVLHPVLILYFILSDSRQFTCEGESAGC